MVIKGNPNSVITLEISLMLNKGQFANLKLGFFHRETLEDSVEVPSECEAFPQPPWKKGLVVRGKKMHTLQ